MEGPVVDRPVAEERDSHAVAFEDLEAVPAPAACRMQGPTIPLVPIRPISGANRCMLPPRPREQPVARPNSSAISCRGLQTLGQGMAVPPVGAEDDVVGFQMSTNPGGDRLLADVRVAGPVNQAALVAAGQLFFALANGLHRAIETQQGLFRRADLIVLAIESSRHRPSACREFRLPCRILGPGSGC